MKAPIALTLALALAACGSAGESRLNPLNWFGRATPTAIAVPAGSATTLPDGRQPVEQVTLLRVEPSGSGAVVEARGLPPVQGFWDAELVATGDGRPVDGVLVYELRVFPPLVPRPAGPPASREVVVGAAIPSAVLRDVRVVRVLGRLNAVEVRR